MARTVLKWLEMPGNAGMAGNSWNGWEWLEMADNFLKLLDMARHGMGCLGNA